MKILIIILIALLPIQLVFAQTTYTTTKSYQYDSLGRFNKVVFGDNATIRFNYDERKNRISTFQTASNDIRIGLIDTVYCRGENFWLPYTTFGPYQLGNTFTAWLFDSAGTFTPQPIGSRIDTTSGMILCQIPNNSLLLSLRCRIYLSADMPAIVSSKNFLNSV